MNMSMFTWTCAQVPVQAPLRWEEAPFGEPGRLFWEIRKFGRISPNIINGDL